MRQAVASIAIASAIALAGTASAQPGQTPHTAPSRYHLLSDEELEIVARGEISDEAHFGGGLVGTFFGFGLGHAVQGRFGDRGWIFLTGEAASGAFLIWGMSECFSLVPQEGGTGETCGKDARFLVGGIGLVAFRIWELIDVWAGPPAYNARVRDLRVRAGLPPYALFAAPLLGRGDAGGVAGLTTRF
jgi:hypothetical protein